MRDDWLRKSQSQGGALLGECPETPVHAGKEVPAERADRVAPFRAERFFVGQVVDAAVNEQVVAVLWFSYFVAITAMFTIPILPIPGRVQIITLIVVVAIVAGLQVYSKNKLAT